MIAQSHQYLVLGSSWESKKKNEKKAAIFIRNWSSHSYGHRIWLFVLKKKNILPGYGTLPFRVCYNRHFRLLSWSGTHINFQGRPSFCTYSNNSKIKIKQWSKAFEVQGRGFYTFSSSLLKKLKLWSSILPLLILNSSINQKEYDPAFVVTKMEPKFLSAITGSD